MRAPEFISAAEHAQAVARLRGSYEAIPAGAAVRLTKQTSNLFRPRTREVVAGLDVSGLTGVLGIDAVNRTADVQGMATYETVVAATLAVGLMPLVVPQLRTITVGGAVTGLGIESSSFRNGLPHESVKELDILTGDGRLLTATATQHPDLYQGFPNSYGSLGYAVRLRIELEPVRPFVALRHVRFTDLKQLCNTVADICASGAFDSQPVDFLDGVMFSPSKSYLTLGRWADHPSGSQVSDYTGQQIYYRSIEQRETDCLTVEDYLWRWDTDWFWCSATFGVQNPRIRRVWPARYRRSDFYHRLIGLEQRFGVAARIDRMRKLPPRERVVQDVEIPLDQTADFLSWFDATVGMSPVWLCPLRLRPVESAGPQAESAVTPVESAGQPAESAVAPVESAEPESPWPMYPLSRNEIYVNAGFWGMVPIAGGAADGDVNRAVEDAVSERAGHKSLYSDAYYDRSTFEKIYGGAAYAELKDRYDPSHRLTGLYEKAVGRR